MSQFVIHMLEISLKWKKSWVIHASHDCFLWCYYLTRPRGRSVFSSNRSKLLKQMISKSVPEGYTVALHRKHTRRFSCWTTFVVGNLWFWKNIIFGTVNYYTLNVQYSATNALGRFYEDGSCIRNYEHVCSTVVYGFPSHYALHVCMWLNTEESFLGLPMFSDIHSPVTAIHPHYLCCSNQRSLIVLIITSFYYPFV